MPTLPKIPASVVREQPALWNAYEQLGLEAIQAGPVQGSTSRLVHLALAIACESEGATHSHARRGLSDGISPEELEHVALLAITTLGWPKAMQGLSWVRDITRPPE